MFVLKSKYDKLYRRLYDKQVELGQKRLEYIDLMSKYRMLQLEFSELLTQRQSSTRQTSPKQETSPQFTKEEIQTLVKLCHPDKHGQKPEATEITKKLLQLR